MNEIKLGRRRTQAKPTSRTFPLIVLIVLGYAIPLGARGTESRSPEKSPSQATESVEDAGDEDPIVSLTAYNVKADRIEDFGLRIEAAPYPDAARRLTSGTIWFSKFAPLVTTVIPNTAAEKAGLQPGERILESDGRPTIGGLFSTGKFGAWSKSQKKKWADVAAGKTNVTWTLKVESPATRSVRTVRLVIPTTPPHWGASIWRTPPGRKPSVVLESGPLAERSRVVLDNGIATLLGWPHLVAVGAEEGPRARPSVIGYEWRLENGRHLHRILVTPFGGRTLVFLETVSPSTGRRVYLTSPSGELQRAWLWGRKENIAFMKAKTAEAAAKVGEVNLKDAQAGFAHELDLWATQVRKVSLRWPMEVSPGYDPDAIFAVLAPQGNTTDAAAAAPPRPLAAEFVKLPSATEAQRELFADAYGKLGAEQDVWAYTETTRNLGDNRVLITRVDPSKPEAERSVLVSVDGEPPTPAQTQQWRDDGGDVPKVLGDLPPLASLVDLKDLRVAQEEAAAVVFELPTRGGDAEFPSEKFQALFRVNRSTRGFDEITIKLRDAFRLAGVVKITEAGLHAQFQSLDPSFPPQPVRLKGGGAARIVLVKFARDFETIRSHYSRVYPSDEAAVLGK
ncbi:MAG TPA: PDZ domain-containing protein [Opitutaceae bacterium]|nr:PDZ domain-containing protein [Opitutaceae bacterium]